MAPSTALPITAWPRPLAFVLSGGGSFGAAQVGMLQALAEAEIEADLIVGSSVGALNGALVAVDPEDAPARLARLWNKLDPCADVGRRVLGSHRLGAVATLARTRRAIADHRGLAAVIEREIGRSVRRIEDMPCRFVAVATDVDAGTAICLERGDLESALLASAAIPGVFPAVQRDGRRLIDGGITANVPVRQAVELGAASLIVLDVTPTAPLVQSSPSLRHDMIHTLALLVRSQRDAALAAVEGRQPMLILDGGLPPELASFDFSRTAELIATAREGTRRVITR